MKQNKLMKHLKRVARVNKNRPMLSCVNYNKNGSLYATDTHRVIAVDGFHNYGNDVNINVRTLEINDERFPDISRIIPSTDNGQVKLLTEDLFEISKLFKKYNVENPVRLVITKNEITFSDRRFSISVPILSCNGGIEISFQGRYLFEAFDFVRDAQDYVKTGQVTTIYYNSSIRPVLIDSGNGYKYILTPVITPKGRR
ncbi:hypothetical protein CKN63_13595 [Carnobacterium divergens]|uniref:Uncharacterized protein n=1 Tax=Carnobacterium divergens TaxID=2748 RepID=A0A7Z8G6D3_CARDV|nr:hypothetical protein [Carnobacterium divergens]TFI60481.1 hypothetical protein CKN59_13505 [Carnobacterium divergens]TFI60487.1 hypothetical protein CKN76_13585 [Carnobacterium divergens]TFI76583.1 hypothetical protein CKN58_00830 [Carnobacterium divergens]TFI77061.1 hypothetical protein CKN74_13010 [Carnobacterium divergens]TFI80128.1 hypothetical protein CKN85_00830 [Carnobacterium divergens]